MRMSLIRASLVLVAVGQLAGIAAAQQAEPDRYVVATYIKILPGQDEAYRTQISTVGKQLYQAMMAADSTFLSWSVARAMYQGVEHGAPDFDYVAASVYAGSPPEPGRDLDAIVQQATGMSGRDFQAKMSTMRTVVGSEVLRYRAGTSAPGAFAEGDFRVAARLKIKPGMGDEYMAMAQTIGQPMLQALVANGELKGWSVWSRVFPAGAATSYDALTVTYFEDLASAIAGIDPAKGLEAFTTTHPGKSYATYINNQRDYSELQQRNIMQVIALVER